MLLYKSLIFIPNPDKGNFFPFLGVGWTLNLEMFFYIVLWGILFFTKRWAAILGCLFLIGIKAIAPLIRDDFPVLHFYSHSYTTFFVLGVITYYCWMFVEKYNFIKRRSILWTISCITILSFLVINACFEYNSIYLTWFLPFSLVLVALLLHSAGVQCTWKPALVLGNSSYALYLIHSLWLEVQRPLAAKQPVLNFNHSLIGVIIALVVSSLIAVGVHYRIEKPMIEFFRRRFSQKEKIVISDANVQKI